VGADGFSLLYQANLDFFTRFFGHVHQMDGSGQIRRTAADEQYVKLQSFSGLVHLNVLCYKNYFP
jgi:hypothetical protein